MLKLISIILIVIVARNIFSLINTRKREAKTDSDSFSAFDRLKKDQIQDAEFEEVY